MIDGIDGKCEWKPSGCIVYRAADSPAECREDTGLIVASNKDVRPPWAMVWVGLAALCDVDDGEWVKSADV